MIVDGADPDLGPNPVRLTMHFAFTRGRNWANRPQSEANRKGMTSFAAIAKGNRVKAQREMVAREWRIAKADGAPLPKPPARVTFIRHARGKLDTDNLLGAFKAFRDEVAYRLGVDDREGSGVCWRYAQQPAETFAGGMGATVAIEGSR